MVHAPQLGLYGDHKRKVLQAEFDALLTGRCTSCGDELESGKSINGLCQWCLTVVDAYRPLW